MNNQKSAQQSLSATTNFDWNYYYKSAQKILTFSWYWAQNVQKYLNKTMWIFLSLGIRVNTIAPHTSSNMSALTNLQGHIFVSKHYKLPECCQLCLSKANNKLSPVFTAISKRACDAEHVFSGPHSEASCLPSLAWAFACNLAWKSTF